MEVCTIFDTSRGSKKEVSLLLRHNSCTQDMVIVSSSAVVFGESLTQNFTLLYYEADSHLREPHCGNGQSLSLQLPAFYFNNPKRQPIRGLTQMCYPTSSAIHVVTVLTSQCLGPCGKQIGTALRDFAPTKRELRTRCLKFSRPCAITVDHSIAVFNTPPLHL